MARFRNRDYLAWVAGLPCCACSSQLDVCAHHLKGRGQMSGGGLKAPDQWSMPLCVDCHERIHNGDRAMLNKQVQWAGMTMAKFVEQVAAGLGSETMGVLLKGIGCN